MSDQYKQEQQKQAQSKITELEKRRAAIFGQQQAAQQAANDLAGDVAAIDSNLAQARAALEAVTE